MGNVGTLHHLVVFFVDGAGHGEVSLLGQVLKLMVIAGYDASFPVLVPVGGFQASRK